MNRPLFLDVHVLHPVPFSNLNRDNLGSPKQLVFGGATRARISSQCAKRATRLWLEANGGYGRALRTRLLPEKVRAALTGLHGLSDTDAIAATTNLFALAKIKVSQASADGEQHAALQGDQLTFTTTDAAEALAAAAVRHMPDITGGSFKPKKAAQDDLLAPLGEHNAVIALCGRMLADRPSTNVDAALQMAHAFTTHVSSLELDYFTAVDDEVDDDDEQTGAGHINVNEFTSGVFYRHATVDLDELSQRLDESADATADLARSFVRGFMLAEPTGKQNSANAHTRPALVAATLRTDRPVSYAAAFEEPVSRGRDGGFTGPSITRLAEHAAAEEAFYGDEGIIGAWCAATDPQVNTDGLGGRFDSLQELLDKITAAVSESRQT